MIHLSIPTTQCSQRDEAFFSQIIAIPCCPSSSRGKHSSGDSGCEDPLAAILSTLDCVEVEDVACAAAGYAPEFVKLHNGVDTNTVINPEFWEFAFLLVDLDLDYDFQMNVGPNQASIRYIETVTVTDGSSLGLPPSSEYPFSAQIIQHEWALVTVNDECEMTLWDQYGDNQEQSDVDDAVGIVLCLAGVISC